MTMRYKQGMSRDQIPLLITSLDDYILEDNIVRAIDAFVDCLNMAELNFKYATTTNTGACPYSPADLLKLYFYSYLERIRSSRQIEKATHVNLEVIWLLKTLRPSYKTISDFRNNNKKALKEVFKLFNKFCKQESLFGAEIIAIDGSKFKAWNAKKKNFTISVLNKKLDYINQKINEYLKELDTNDEKEEIDESKDSEKNKNDDHRLKNKDEIKKSLDNLHHRKKQYQEYKKRIEDGEVNQVSLTDPDSRKMKNNQRFEICYNVQTAVDSKNKLIADYLLTNQENDYGLLSVIAKQVKEFFDKEKLEVLADTGYYMPTDLKECVENDINPYIPTPNPKRSNKFSVNKFEYNREKDCYICQNGNELEYRHKTSRKGISYKRYFNYSACQQCSIRDQCTSSKDGRVIDRWVDQELLEEIEKQTKVNKDKYRQRQCLVEHPFGTLKRNMGAYYFLTTGIDSVNFEIGLSLCVYNFKRVINIMGIKEFIRKIKEWSKNFYTFLPIIVK